MCPDWELLSAYLDNEVPSPWKEKIAAELERDPDCRAVFEQISSTRTLLHEGPEPDFAAAKEAVWQRIVDAAPSRRSVPVWSRRIAVPLPVVAAVATLLLMLGAGLLWHTARATVAPGEIAATPSGNELVVRIGEISIEELLRVINAGETVGELTVTLPESATFGIFGEPQLVRVSDDRREEAVIVPLRPGANE